MGLNIFFFQKNATKDYEITNYDTIDMISLQRSYSIVDNNTFSRTIDLSKRDNEDCEEVIDDTLIDNTSFIDRIVLPIPKLYKRLITMSLTKMIVVLLRQEQRILKATTFSIANNQCKVKMHEPLNSNDIVQSNTLFDKIGNKNNSKTTSSNKKHRQVSVINRCNTRGYRQTKNK